MSALRAAPSLVALLGLYTASSGCSWTLDLDGYRSRDEGSAIGSLDRGGSGADAGPLPGVTSAGRDAGSSAPEGDALLYDYRFPRGAPSFSIPAAEGLASQLPAGADLGLTPGSVATTRGGTVEVAVDGSFTFTPAGAPGAFWGTDQLELGSSSGRLRTRLTVYPERLRLTELPSSGGAGFALSGTRSLDRVGVTTHGLAPAGDVNGDGLEDVVLGFSGDGSTTDDGILFAVGRGAYVLFGTRSATDISLAAPPEGAGFFVWGDDDPETLDSFGSSVAGVGDVNGDGFDDVIISSQSRGLRVGGTIADSHGAAYVVFGKPDASDVASSALDAAQGGGFVIQGSSAHFLAGFAVAPAGDVNGDGLADILVTSPYTIAVERVSAIFVVFGKIDGTAVSLDTLSSGASDRGVAFLAPEGELWGASATGLGDVNGDGLDDIAFGGSPSPTGDAAQSAGRVRVVFGQRNFPSQISLADLDLSPGLSLLISEAALGDLADVVHRAGDVNGDGLDDVLISATNAIRRERLETADAGVDAGAPVGLEGPNSDGMAYVVLGSSAPPAAVSLLPVERGGLGGFAISGSTTGIGVSLASGDVDADGHADVLVSTFPSFVEAGSYLVFGQPEPGAVRLDSGSPQQLLKIEGDVAERSGFVVATGADVNGDGLDDLLINAPGYRGNTAGGAYLAFSWDMRGTLSGRGPALSGGRNDDVFELPVTPPILVRGGHGRDTLRAGARTPTVDLRARGRWESLEVIDVRGGGPHRVLLDEVALRRIPENEPGFAFSLVRKLTVLGDAEDRVELGATGFSPRGSNAGRAVYGKAGVYYGLEVSQAMAFTSGVTPE